MANDNDNDINVCAITEDDLPLVMQVDMFTGISNKGGDPMKQFTILQWNTLADALSNAFPHISDPKVLSWDHRKPLIQRLLTTTQCDFVCLEEVDHYHDSFSEFMMHLGYSGHFVERRVHEESPISRDGVAIFWKADRFERVVSQSLAVSKTDKVFGVVINFEEKISKQNLLIGAVHLTAKPDRLETRLKEIKHTTDLIKEFVCEDDMPVIIAGDFNDTPDSAVCQHMLESGYLCSDDDIRWTTWKKRDVEVKRVIDYIWYSTFCRQNLCCTPARNFPIFGICDTFLPTARFPSDHIPIGAFFEIITPPSQ